MALGCLWAGADPAAWATTAVAQRRALQAWVAIAGDWLVGLASATLLRAAVHASLVPTAPPAAAGSISAGVSTGGGESGFGGAGGSGGSGSSGSSGGGDGVAGLGTRVRSGIGLGIGALRCVLASRPLFAVAQLSFTAYATSFLAASAALELLPPYTEHRFGFLGEVERVRG